MGKKCLSAWKALLLLHLLQLFTVINSTTISEATASSEVEAESSQPISQPQVQVQVEPEAPAPAPRVVIQTSSMSQSQGYPPPASRRQQHRPRFQVSHQRYRMDPYDIMKPTMMAQDRIFNELVTAATIVPKLFGGDKPLWVPHKYFNLCPMVDPNSDSMWALGCQGFPNQVSNGQQVPWASQQATAGAGGWSHAAMTPFVSPFNMAPNNVLGFPPGFLGFPSMYPYYANPNPGMPPPAYPTFVSNEEGTNIDMGNMFASSGPSTGTGTGSSSISSMFFNSIGMGGNPAAGATASTSTGGNGNQMNGMALYSGTGYGSGGGMSGYGSGGGMSGYGSGGGMSGYGSGGGMGGSLPMTPYPFPYAIGILPMGYGYDGDYGTGWPSNGAWAGGWNRNEMNSEDRRSSSSDAAASAKAKAGTLEVRGETDSTTGTGTE